MSDSNVAPCVAEDATLFGRVQHGGDWLSAYLVARNVAKQTGGGGPRVEMPGPSKVSARQFAELSGVSNRTVGTWLDVWDYCASQGVWWLNAEGGRVVLPSSDQLVPGAEDGEWSLTHEELTRLNDQRDWRAFRKEFQAAKRDEAQAMKQVQQTSDEVVREVGFEDEQNDDDLFLDDDEFAVPEGSDASDEQSDAGEQVGDVSEEAGHIRRPDRSAQRPSQRGMDGEQPAASVTATVADWRASGDPRQVTSRRFGTIERELQELLAYMMDQDDFGEDALRTFQGNLEVLRVRLDQIETLIAQEAATA